MAAGKIYQLSDVDRLLCRLLEVNARLSLTELAEQIGLSVTATSDHIRKLESAGVITGYHAHLSPAALGLDITAFVFVWVEGSSNYPHFIAQCRKVPAILECHAITGEASHLLKVRVPNTAALEELLSTIQRWKGVQRTQTSLVLSTPIETTCLLRNVSLPASHTS
ncbi:MAG: Lrp/AsnC family transcriptional regulator [Candidatus Kapabacteria bacterium]|nr:Lrp/AsnC family transcriptional regulator [Candidatus Kapabacteria bacterium]MCX7937407.1 Lrp/AsnC family transcriptional regulator [Chlorobiota bacterium]